MTDKCYIVDLDGTLYFQIPVRLMMLAELSLYYIFHLSRIKDILIISQYRKNHEENKMCSDAVLAEQYGTNKDYVTTLLNEWMIKRPLKWIKIFADRRLLKILRDKKVIVYSDYPTDEKLQALEFIPTAQYFCDGVNIKCYKPNPQGMEFISCKHNLTKNDVLMIGDRMSHDGECAKRFGCKFIILQKTSIGRLVQYRKIK